MEAPAVVLPPISLLEIVRMIQNGDPAGAGALDGVVHRGVCLFLTRHLGANVAEDVTQDVLLDAVEFVRGGKLDEPDAVIRLIWIIARRRLDAALRERKGEGIAANDEPGMTAESDSLDLVRRREQVEVAVRVLKEMPGHGREVLARFYLRAQTPERICADMGITQAQFRLMKSTARRRFAELGNPSLPGAASESAEGTT